MLDPSTPKGRIISAALECAAAKPWGDVTLLDIAEAAKLPLIEVQAMPLPARPRSWLPSCARSTTRCSSASPKQAKDRTSAMPCSTSS